MLNLKKYFDRNKYGLAVNVSEYVTHREAPMPDLHFTDPYVDKLYSKLAKTPERMYPGFILPERFKDMPWATATKDCNGNEIKFRCGDTNPQSRNAQLVVADICMRMKEKGAESVYLYWPYEYNMTCSDRDEFKTIAIAVQTVLTRLLKREIGFIDFTTGVMAGTECPGYLILTSEEHYDQFFQDIGAIMDTGTEIHIEALDREFLYTVVNTYVPFDSNGPAVSTKDIDLELEVALGIDETPFTPEKFANRLLVDYGYVFDANSIIRGTKLAKIHRVWSVLPMMAGSVADHYALMERVIEFCIANANITPPEDKCKKSSSKKDDYFAKDRKRWTRKSKGPTFHRPPKDTTPSTDDEDEDES
ncbi:MAG: hypothetical protein NC311_05835 [Muribaculaceae bacterium]|nr:hypothetical protein [Muribaculaceae bacterium]